jgi:S-DNA-T family DNA segregation ATPase FtsK/SpoIIIE
MTKTGTIVKALQAVLLVTALTPATVLAAPASNRQPAAQTQDQPAAGEAKHINRGLILPPAEAATNANAQRPVEIPAITAPQVEIPALPPRPEEGTAASATNNYSTAAAPVATTTAQTSSIVTLPALPQPAADTSAPATTSAPVTTEAVATPAPVTTVTPAATTVPTPAAVTTPPATTATTKVDPATTSTEKASSTRTAQTSHHSHARHNDDNFNFGGFNVDTGNINRQFTKFFNRRDVKSILSQYGLD